MKRWKVFPFKASAGLGIYNYDDEEVEELEFPVNEVPHNADHGIWIEGDSMEPQISNGSVAWIRTQPVIENSEIGIFYYDEALLCKRFHRDRKNNIQLISLNDAYGPITIDRLKEFRVIGKVLGTSIYDH